MEHKSWKLNKNILIQPLMELLSFMLNDTMRSQTQNFFA
jgi:hypothetical protein